MISQDEMLERVLQKVSDQVAESVRGSVTEAVQRELSSAMTKAMVESEFYRSLNDEMLSGLRGIYQEISSASHVDNGAPADSSQTQKLFTDATKQIEEVMQTTLEAAESIMETAEKLICQQEETGRIIASLPVSAKGKAALSQLEALNNNLGDSLTGIMTSLSFQDLTGQRLKKVLTSIGSIQETVFDLYVSTGIMMKSREEAPEKDIAQLAAESKKKVAEIKNSELKGPTLGTSQANVDDLLASLGL